MVSDFGEMKQLTPRNLDVVPSVQELDLGVKVPDLATDPAVRRPTNRAPEYRIVVPEQARYNARGQRPGIIPDKFFSNQVWRLTGINPDEDPGAASPARVAMDVSGSSWSQYLGRRVSCGRSYPRGHGRFPCDCWCIGYGDMMPHATPALTQNSARNTKCREAGHC